MAALGAGSKSPSGLSTNFAAAPAARSEEAASSAEEVCFEFLSSLETAAAAAAGTATGDAGTRVGWLAASAVRTEVGSEAVVGSNADGGVAALALFAAAGWRLT